MGRRRTAASSRGPPEHPCQRARDRRGGQPSAAARPRLRPLLRRRRSQSGRAPRRDGGPRPLHRLRPRHGLLTCEAGVRLADILDAVCRPSARAAAGSCPCRRAPASSPSPVPSPRRPRQEPSRVRHVRPLRAAAIELARSDGTVETITPESHPDLFAATIGGLGLTGLILSATIRLRRVAGTALEAEDIRFDDSTPSSPSPTIRMPGNTRRPGSTASRPDGDRPRDLFAGPPRPGSRRRTAGFASAQGVPLTPPISPRGGLSLKAFNALYWRKLGRERVLKTAPTNPSSIRSTPSGLEPALRPDGLLSIPVRGAPGTDGRAAIAEMCG